MIGLGLFMRVGQQVIGGLNALLKALIERATYSENTKDSNTIIEAINDAGILDDATILLTPTAWSSAILHSVKDGTSDSDFDVVSDTDATRVNSSGLIEDIDANQPRINYNPDGTNGHILLEPTSTNKVAYSEVFDKTSTDWLESSSPTVTSTSIANPTGSSGAYEILSTSSASRLQLNLGTLAAGSYTQSIFVKRKDADVRISFRNNVLSGNNTFNITESGVELNSGSELNKIEDYGNGWFRISITYTADGATASYLQVFGDVVSTFDAYYIWGCQLENLSYPTSYIPTNGAAVTRSGETLTGSGSTSLINSRDGVLYAEINALSYPLDFNSWLTITDTTANNSVGIVFETTPYVTGRVEVGGVNQAYLANDVDYSNFVKVALKYKENDFALWINGVEVATDTSGSTFSANTLKSLQFSYGGGTNNWNGKVKAIAVFNRALTDQELTDLTS